MAVPGEAEVQDLPGGDVERREQCRGPMPPVVMGHRPRPARGERQRRLAALQGLALGLLVEAQHHRPLGRVQVEPHDIDELGLEVRVVRQLEGRDTPRLEVPGPPDPGHGVLTDTGVFGHRPSRPVRRARLCGVQRVVHDPVDHLGGDLRLAGLDLERSPRRRPRPSRRTGHATGAPHSRWCGSGERSRCSQHPRPPSARPWPGPPSGAAARKTGPSPRARPGQRRQAPTQAPTSSTWPHHSHHRYFSDGPLARFVASSAPARRARASTKTTMPRRTTGSGAPPGCALARRRAHHDAPRTGL